MNIRIIPKQVAIPKCSSTGKWYARAQHIGTVSSEQLAEELSQSSSVTQADLVAFSLFSEHNGISRDNVEAGVIPKLLKKSEGIIFTKVSHLQINRT